MPRSWSKPVDGFVTNQNDAGAFRDVLVIRDVDHRFGQALFLNPTMKYGDGVAQMRMARRRGEQLYAEVLDVHMRKPDTGRNACGTYAATFCALRRP